MPNPNDTQRTCEGRCRTGGPCTCIPGAIRPRCGTVAVPEMMCKCCDSLTTKSEMVDRHGTARGFADAVRRAIPSFVSVTEAETAAERYRQQLYGAPNA